MTDVVDPATRSRMMSGIRGKNTSPERRLRSRLHCEGFRFRLHTTGLPGKPDIVLPARKIAIFVHGCFWHRHEGCHWCSTPVSNVEFWSAKFDRNKERDSEVVAALREADWRVATVWECGLRPASINATVIDLIGWIQSDATIFESNLIRLRKILT